MEKNKWRKILYERQDFPDNYVDPSFLDKMRKNVHTPIYSFSTVIFESGVVSQQLSSVMIFVAAFMYMDTGAISSHAVMFIGSSVSGLGYLFYKQIGHAIQMSQQRTVKDDLKSMFMFYLFTSGLSPVLWTLTDTISTDTIYAMTTMMLASNLLFHDYGAGSAIVSKAVSLNAGIFAAVCLGSRLPSSWHVTTTVVLAMQLFALLPELRNRVKALHPLLYIGNTLVLGATSILLMLPLSGSSAVALTLGHCCITFLFPFWMVRLQRYKNNIHGPWDEATIKG